MAEIAGLSCKTEQEIEQARVRLLGKKGEITALFDEFRTVAPELKREFGQKLNVLKNTAAAKIEELKNTVAEGAADAPAAFDYTMPGDPVGLGSRHPVSIAREEIVGIFRKFGYDVAEVLRLRMTGMCLRRSTSRLSTLPARCRTHSSSMTATILSFSVPTLLQCRYVLWRRCRFLSVSYVLAVCSVTRLFLRVRTAFSTRSRDFTSMKMSHSLT